jgi:tetratricopeptide (TPR) repeat protein
LNDSDELDRAIVESTAALRLDDECVSALLCRANAKIKKGDPRAGIADLDRAVELSPRDHEPEIDLAWAYNDLGEHAKALAHADRAISYKADAHEAHCQRGEANRRLGKPRAAIEDLTTAIRYRPDYHLAFRERAKAYRDLGETAPAEADEKEADAIEAKAKK